MPEVTLGVCAACGGTFGVRHGVIRIHYAGYGDRRPICDGSRQTPARYTPREDYPPGISPPGDPWAPIGPGTRVTIDDPYGYRGTGEVVRIQLRPHHAVLVRLDEVTDRAPESYIGREVWVLTAHVAAL